MDPKANSQQPTGKGERLIIINAITKAGWIHGAKFVFKSTKKTGDYHGQMNIGLFLKWFTEKLLPNIPDRSLIIMDNAAYHNALSEYSAPTVSSSKDKIFTSGSCLPNRETTSITQKFFGIVVNNIVQ